MRLPLLTLLALVVADYELMRGDSFVARGPTSLVLVRDGARWGILKDHSS